MTEPIELFRIIKKVRQTFNIYAPQSDRKLQFAEKNLLILIAQLSVLLSEASFLLFKAKSIAEYGTCFSIFNLALTNIIFYSMNHVQKENVVKLIRNFEDFIEMSK